MTVVEMNPDASQSPVADDDARARPAPASANANDAAETGARRLDLESKSTSEAPDGPPSNTAISQDAIDLIVGAEIGSEADYRRQYHKPEWPQGTSGVTIGIGYDCGYTTSEKLAQDWKGVIPDDMIAKLQQACGVTGRAAAPLAKLLADQGVDIPFDVAMSVFKKTDIPRWVGIVQRALPNTDALSEDCLGALVSLAYNRGASFSTAGERYQEMNNIEQHMANRNFTAIPAEFRAMKRLWPNLRGLLIRREKEAQLFERGLGKAAGT